MEAPGVKVSAIYFDHNATTPLHPAVREAMANCLGDRAGNPSSIHQFGRRSRTRLERARTQVATLVGADGDELVFTSGGSESDHLALHGAAWIQRRRSAQRCRIVVSAVEHPAVLGAAQALGRQGFELVLARVHSDGSLDEQAFLGAIDDRTALVSLQLANHELGNLYPIAPLVERAHAMGALFHTDAVQALGKIPIDVHALGVDLASFSAHKIYGPQGCGALYVKRGLQIEPLLSGGHQERGQRAGTENVIGQAGFGQAADRARAELEEWRAHTTELRDQFEVGVRGVGARINGSPTRVGNTSNVAFDGVEAELLVENLDLVGVAVSAGAACTSGSREPSPVLLALGQSRRQAASAVRFSFGRGNTSKEVADVLALLPSLLDRIRSA